MGGKIRERHYWNPRKQSFVVFFFTMGWTNFWKTFVKDIHDEIRVVKKGVLEVNEPFNGQKTSTAGIMQWQKPKISLFSLQPKLLCLCSRHVQFSIISSCQFNLLFITKVSSFYRTDLWNTVDKVLLRKYNNVSLSHKNNFSTHWK